MLLRDLSVRVRLIVFDCDGTLIRPPPIDWGRVKAKIRKFFERHGMEFKRRSALLVDVLEHLLLLSRDREKFYELRDELYQQIAEEELAGLEAGVEEAFDVEGLLKFLKARGVRLAVFSSNCREFVERVLSMLGVRSLFDVVVAREDVWLPKPYPEGLIRIMRETLVPPWECVMVGDTTYDVEAAKRAGCVAVGVLTGRTQEEALRKAGADLILAHAGLLRLVLEEVQNA